MEKKIDIIEDLNGNKIVMIRHANNGKMYLYDLVNIKNME